MKGNALLYTLAVVLVVLWGLGLVTHLIFGGLLYFLPVMAIVMVFVAIISGSSHPL